MTDHHHDPLLDELASAHLDGTTSAEEAARVTADPVLRARVEELRAIRAAVGEVPAVDPGRREAAIAVALAAFDEPLDHPQTPAPAVAPVTSLAAVAARRRSSPTARRLLGVAAAIVLLALLVPLLAGLDGGSRDDEASDTATAFQETGGDEAVAEDGEGGEGAAGSAPESAADGAATTTTTTSTRSGARLELGTFDELEALVEAVEQEAAVGGFQASAPLAGTPESTDADDPCAATAPPGSSTATATLDGEPVLVVVTTDADGARTLQIFAAEACNLLVERPL